MEKTEIETALKVKEALIVLMDLTGLRFTDLVARICFCDKDIQAKLIDASNKWNAFEDADIVERGKMLGLEIKLSHEQVSK